MIEKSAGILGALGKASLSVGKSAIKSPMKTVGAVMGISGAASAAKKGLESNPVAPQNNQRFVNKKYVTANEILNGIDKKAKENNDKKEIKKDIATGAIGAKMIHSSKDKILGQKTLYHGTSSKNWENIKKEGLRADKGGINGASDAIKSDLYKNDSKNKVHATAKKWKADMYSRIGESSDKVSKTPEAKKYTEVRNKFTDKDGKIVFNGTTNDEVKKQVKSFRKAHKDFTKVQFKEMAKNKGKVAKIKMDYNKYKKMEIDPFEQGQAFGNLAKKVKNKGAKEVLNNMGKDFAARGNINITPDEIVGLHNPAKRLAKTVKNIPHYAKTNKGRFGAGLALAGTGGTLMSKSIKDIKNKMNKEAAVKPDKIMDKAKDVIGDYMAAMKGKEAVLNRSENKVRKAYNEYGKVYAKSNFNNDAKEVVELKNKLGKIMKKNEKIKNNADKRVALARGGTSIAGVIGSKAIIDKKMNKEANLKEDAKNLGIGIAGGILTNIAQDQWQLARDRKNKKDQWELTKSLAKNKKKEGEVKMDMQKKASEILKEAACKTSACKTAVCKKGACKTAEGCGTEGQNMEQDAACGDKKAACKTSACKTASEMLEEILAKKAEEEVEKEAGECGGKDKMCGKPEGKGCKMEEDDDMEDDDDDDEECEGKECKMKQEGACKKASEVLEEAVIEKEAGIGSIAGKIGAKVTSMGGVSGIANKAKNLGGDYVAAMKGKGAVAARADKQAANAANKLGDAIKSGANDATKNNLFQNYTKTRQQSDKAIVNAGKRVALARGGTGVVGAAGLGAAMKNRQMEQNGACKKASEDLDKAVIEKEAAAGAMPGGANNAPKKFIGKGLGVAGAGLGAAGLVAAGIAKMKANKPNVPSNNPTMQQTSACKTAEEIEQEAACKTSEMEKETACKTATCKKGACKTAEGCGTEGQNMEQDAACGDKKAACKTSACKTASEDFIKDTFESALIKTANEMCGEVEKKATTQKDIDDKFRELFNTLNW